MNRYFLFSMLIFCSAKLLAQGSQVSTDSVEVEKNDKFAIYLGPSYTLSDFAETGSSLVGIQVGGLFFDKIDVSFSYLVILDNFKKRLIFPTMHSYDQQDIALSVHYNFTKGKLKPLIGIGYRFTQAAWQPENESGEKFIDHINQFEIFGGINYDISKIFRLELQGGYKLADEVELTGLPEKAYDGFLFRANLKFMLFRIKDEY